MKKVSTVSLEYRPNRWRSVWNNREFYLLMLPGVIITIIFSYMPMYGILMAFQDVKVGQSVSEATWVGWSNFERLFKMRMFRIALENTLTLNIVSLLFSIPMPIILALFLHNSPFHRLKRVTQTASYLPYLVSTVVVVSIINLFCNGENGLINIIISKLGYKKISFFGEPRWVLPLYVISGIWQTNGYNAVIYLAALSTVDSELIEAAMIDGANKRQRMWYIDLQTIKPTIITLMILRVGQLMAMGIDKILLLQTPLNIEASETIVTYVYKTGVVGQQIGFSTAVGLFNNVTNLVLLLLMNFLSRKIAKTSLF